MFGRHKSPDKRAADTIALTKSFVIASFIPLLNDGTLPKHVSSKAWDTLAIVAGIYAVMAHLKGSDSDQYAIYGSPLISALRDEVKQGQAALEDCVKFVGKIPPEQMEATVGLWLLWNLLGRQPEYDEAKHAGVIGGMVYRLAIEAWTAVAH
ncbi:hypothetical protein [Afipia sp. DC4300-2b1]|uniref:hypothetical protein n=1 Tax=Afipia sp. DC4300-2b1 TaxID=2804672 RepID=UPI003CF6742B